MSALRLSTDPCSPFGRRLAGESGKAGGVSAAFESDLIGTWEVTTQPSALTYDTCFLGGEEYGACASCGYYEFEEDAQGSYDCVECADGYEIDVFFDDCTGSCVPIGTAETPISASDCRPPGESLDVVHFGEDGRLILNEYESGELVSILEFKYSVERNSIRLSEPRRNY